MVTVMSGNVTGSGSPDAEETLDGDDAASALGVSLAVLQGWAEQLAFPHDVGEPGAPRFRRAEVEALQATLSVTHSVEGAVRAAQERLGGGPLPSP
jgi:hypothetical protein